MADDLSRNHKPRGLIKIASYIFPCWSSLLTSLEPLVTARFTVALLLAHGSKHLQSRRPELTESAFGISPVMLRVRYHAGAYNFFYPKSLYCLIDLSSSRKYLNSVRLVQLEARYTNPLVNNLYLTYILKGLRRYKRSSSNQKQIF